MVQVDHGDRSSGYPNGTGVPRRKSGNTVREGTTGRDRCFDGEGSDPREGVEPRQGQWT